MGALRRLYYLLIGARHLFGMQRIPKRCLALIPDFVILIGFSSALLGCASVPPVCFGDSCTSYPHEYKVDSKYHLKKPYLFEATKDGRTIYFFGTIHLGVGIWEVPDLIKDTLKKSNVAFFEAALGKFKSGKGETYAQKGEITILPGEKTLDQRLSKNEYSILKKEFDAIQFKHLEMLRPGSAFKILYRERAKGHKGNNFDPGYFEHANTLDQAMMQLAHDHKIMTVTLDREASHIYHICRADIDLGSLDRLKRLLAGQTVQQFEDEFDSLVKDYRVGEWSSLEDRYNVPGEGDCILGTRNKMWIPIIDGSTIPGDKAFVVVGLGHLLKHSKFKSVLDLLQEKGYKIRRITEPTQLQLPPH